MRWKGAAPDALLWVAWENDFSLYHRDTGETHLLSALPAELVRQLAGQVMSTETLAERLAQLCEVENDAHWQGRIQSLLRDLQALSLVEPLPR